MLHHVSIGVLDVERAARFYDAILGALGFKRVMEYLPYAVAYGESGPEFWVQLPHDQKPASAGNGVHIGFNAGSKKAVADFHAAAIDSGATDEGAPGPRPDYSPDYYGAFVRDPDGNKLEAVFFATAAKAKTRAQAKTRAKSKTAKARTPVKKKAAPKRKAAAKSAKSPTSRRKPAARRPAPRRGARTRPAKR